jgi:Viral coat protein P2 N-terminal domain
MIKQRVQLRAISNVAASKTALIEIPVGLRYHYIVLQHGYAAGTNTIAAAATNVAEVRVKVNARIQRTASGTQLRDMNILNGTAYDCLGLPNTSPGVSFPIYFAEPWRRDEVDQDALAWPTNGWNSFQIEVDLGAASTPTLVAFAVVDTFQPSGSKGIVKWLRQAIPAAGTSFDYTTLDARDWLQQISFYPDSGGSNAATQLTFRLDGAILHELTNSSNTALLTNYEMTPAASGRTANIYDMVLDHDDLLGSAVNMNGTQSRTITIAAGGAQSGTVTAIIQRLGPPE